MYLAEKLVATKTTEPRNPWHFFRTAHLSRCLAGNIHRQLVWNICKILKWKSFNKNGSKFFNHTDMMHVNTGLSLKDDWGIKAEVHETSSRRDPCLYSKLNNSFNVLVCSRKNNKQSQQYLNCLNSYLGETDPINLNVGQISTTQTLIRKRLEQEHGPDKPTSAHTHSIIRWKINNGSLVQ